MNDSTGAASARPYSDLSTNGGNVHPHRLLWAGFMAILAEGVGFGIRGGVLILWANQYGFTMTDLGAISGGGLVGFGMIVVFSSMIADKIGYGPLMVTAFILHLLSAVLTVVAGPAFAAGGKSAAFQCLYWGMFVFAIGNGLCEAVANPLVATLFPKDKSKYLNILHAGWPAGMVLGGLASYLMSGVLTGGKPMLWQIQICLFLVPVVIYGGMLLNQKFPESEASAHGVKYTDMLREVGMWGAFVVCFFISLWLRDLCPSVGLPPYMGYVGGGALLLAFGAVTGFSAGYPLMFLLLIIHALQGYVELGTDSWITKIISPLVFVYISILMFVLRFFAGPIVERISPLGLLLAGAILSSAGLALLGYAQTAIFIGVAATVFALGKTFMWPTLLAVASEQFPKGGAITIGAMGGVGALAAGLLGGPGIGFTQDYHASQQLSGANAPAYARYKSDAPNKFLFLEATGLDGAKTKVLEDNGQELDRATKLRASEGRRDANLEKLDAWWASAKEFAGSDKPVVTEAGYFGGRMAFRVTAYLAAAQALLLLGILFYFRSKGGYKQVHIEGTGTAAKEVVSS